jgi:RNA polymerase sigma factor (sigma-70 family)
MSSSASGVRNRYFVGEDARTFARIREGDEEALAELYKKNRRPVTALVTRNTGSPDDAEDILQESLIILWERIRTGKHQYTSQLGTFIYATARNLWLQRLARRNRELPAGRMRSPSIPASETEEISGADRRNEPSSGDPDPLTLLTDEEETRAVARAISRLGDPCRQLLLSFYWEELTMEQIAAKMGFANAETAKSKKYQCKKALEKLLREFFTDDD